MKIVFLDIDGVLNSETFYRRHPTPGKWDLDVECVARVNEVCKTSQAKVVLSTSWRVGRRGFDLIPHLRSQGLEGEVIGATPWIPILVEEDIVSSPRGVEIAHWLRLHGRSSEHLGSGLDKFVILDDRDDMVGLENRLVQTNPEIGITGEDAERAISLLR